MLSCAFRILFVLALLALTSCETVPESMAYELEGFDVESYKITRNVIKVTDSDEVVIPVVVRHIPPTYPFAEARKGIGASVYFVMVVDERGVVTDVTVYKATHSAFIKPTIDAVSQWRYTPGTVNGVPHKFMMRNEVHFSMSK